MDKIQNIIKSIREDLCGNKDFSLSLKDFIDYNPNISQTYITLFQEGVKPIRWGSKKQTLEETIKRDIYKLKSHSRFSSFDVEDNKKCRILFEMVTDEKPCNIRNLTSIKMHSSNRFEPGVTGLKYTYEGITRFFMPTDGYIKSIMNVKQLLNFLSKQCGIAKKTNQISERANLMRREAIKYTALESIAYISYENEAYKLERGYPVPLEFSKQIVEDKLFKSLDWLINNMNDDGSFLYFYDPYEDSVVDYLHPDMKNPLYNNILRHSGGTISLLRGYELSKNKIYLESAKKSIDFFISTFKEHTYKNDYACFPFFNKKSKLGGAGIGLVAMMHYYIHTQDEKYRKYLDGLVRHILSRVDEQGEMIGYYIHPKFNNGNPIINPSDEVKKELFSFYYPGEALLGLALYYLNIKNLDESLKKDILSKSEKALDFLVDVRPTKYSYMFKSLPSDAWLMQAIEEWVKVEGLKKQSYIDFVFDDTKQMLRHMYRDENTLDVNKDYIGGFYYNYGDHVYHDASRCEGVISAYYLAKYLNDEEKASWIMNSMMLSAKGLMKTFHDEKSNYCHINPKKALHSFRFKLTRQWVRVDSVQHAACFFSRLLPIYSECEKALENYSLICGKYQILEEIDKAGYSTVYKVEDIYSKKVYALKHITHPRFMQLVENEQKALEIVNEHLPLKFYEKLVSGGNVYFLFDYAKGKNLKKQVETKGAFSQDEVEKFTFDILNTLEFIAEKKLLHLDLKPANILKYKDSYALMDWGTSQRIWVSNSVHLKGNPIYIAPEYYFGKRNIKSELYSLGCSIYFLLVGKHIFGLRKRDNLAKKVYLHLYIKPDLSQIKSKKMRYLLYRLLDKNPFTRANFDEVKQILKGKYEDFEYKQEKILIDLNDEYKLYERMANDSVAFAQNKYARYFLEKDKNTAMLWLEKASQASYSIAQNKLAYIYFTDKKDLNKSFYWFKKAALDEHDMALYYMGVFYENGYVVEKNKDIAIKYYKSSANKGYIPAYERLNQLGIYNEFF